MLCDNSLLHLLLYKYLLSSFLLNVSLNEDFSFLITLNAFQVLECHMDGYMWLWLLSWTVHDILTSSPLGMKKKS